MFKAVWRFLKRLFRAIFNPINEQEIKLSPMQRYMLDSELEWQAAFLEYCWQLDSAQHHCDR